MDDIEAKVEQAEKEVNEFNKRRKERLAFFISEFTKIDKTENSTKKTKTERTKIERTKVAESVAPVLSHSPRSRH
jgi:hypothetical protein